MREVVDLNGDGGAVVGVPVKLVDGTVVEGPGYLDDPMAIGDAFCVVSSTQAMVTLAVDPPDYPGPTADVHIGLHAPGTAIGAAVLLTTSIADRVAELGEGTVEDRIAERLLPPGGWRVADPVGAIDVREHVTIHAVVDDGPGGTWVHTHGLAKFGRPELELNQVAAERIDAATAALLDIGQYLAEGSLIQPGHTLGARSAPILAVAAGADAAHWGNTVVLELIDARGEQPGAPAGLAAWAASAA